MEGGDYACPFFFSNISSFEKKKETNIQQRAPRAAVREERLTTKAPDAAAKGPPTAPGLVVGVGCASRGGEAARTAVEAREVRIWSAAPDLRRGPRRGPRRRDGRMGLPSHGVPEKLRRAVLLLVSGGS